MNPRERDRSDAIDEDVIEDVVPLIPTGDFEEADDDLTDIERYEAYEAARRLPPERESVEALTTQEMRLGETDDPNVAAEEGFTYIPPMDPVVIADRTVPDGARVAAGPGRSALDEPFDEDHHGELLPTEDEMTDRVRDALRADASTSRYADLLTIDTEGGVVTISGEVDDIVDTDNISAVAEMVTGVVEVVDRMRVARL